LDLFYSHGEKGGILLELSPDPARLDKIIYLFAILLQFGHGSITLELSLLIKIGVVNTDEKIAF